MLRFKLRYYLDSFSFSFLGITYGVSPCLFYIIKETLILRINKEINKKIKKEKRGEYLKKRKASFSFTARSYLGFRLLRYYLSLYRYFSEGGDFVKLD